MVVVLRIQVPGYTLAKTAAANGPPVLFYLSFFEVFWSFLKESEGTVCRGILLLPRRFLCFPPLCPLDIFSNSGRNGANCVHAP